MAGLQNQIPGLDGVPLAQNPQAQYRPQYSAYAQTQSPQAQPFDLNAVIAALLLGQQAQGAQRLQGQQAQLEALDPLGRVARSNSRPAGLSSQSSWESMFPTRPTGAGFSGGMGYAPPQMNFADAAMAASPAPFTPTPGGLPPMQDPALEKVKDPAAMLAFNQAFAQNPSAMLRPKPTPTPTPKPKPYVPPRGGFSFGAGIGR